jgi:predicted O-methyltransferase YrrM
MNTNLPRISVVDAVEAARVLRSLTEVNERECVARLAADVPPGGTIVEIGPMYGGMTAVLGLANPQAKIICVDDFGWHPDDDVPSSKKLLLANMKLVGVKGVKVKEGDSREIGKTWDERIDLLWIDGGHSFEFIYQDICNFGAHANVIACHDWDNPAWPSIREAVEKFMADHSEWQIYAVVGMVVVLRK